MKLTKYPQSCFLIEAKGKRILIDPGKFCYSEKFGYDEWRGIDVLLLTHRHHDHCLPEAVQAIAKNNPGVKIYCNEEVTKEIGIDCNVVKVGDVIDADGLTIEVVKAVHGYLPELKPKGKTIQSNNGFIVDDGATRVYHCSDTICFENDLNADVVLVPICGHGVVMEPRVAVEFCQAIGPRLVIPMHYDAPMHPQGAQAFEVEARKAGLPFKVMDNGESITIESGK